MFSTIFTPIMCRAVQYLRGLPGAVSLRMIKHMKTYDGLLESSFMFFVQLVLFSVAPPIGDHWIAGIHNGQCETRF